VRHRLSVYFTESATAGPGARVYAKGSGWGYAPLELDISQNNIFAYFLLVNLST